MPWTDPPDFGGSTVPVTSASIPPGMVPGRRRPAAAAFTADARLRVVPWLDPVADPHGLDPCSRYVELYWLPVIGPSSTWLLRRLCLGLEMHATGCELDMVDTARALGLGDRMGKNAPFRRAIQRLCTFELARPHGPQAVAVRTRIPALPLRHLRRLPESLQSSHLRWQTEQRMPEVERMRRRAQALAEGLAVDGRSRSQIERQLGRWQFHPAVAYRAAEAAEAAEAAVTAPGADRPDRVNGEGDA